MTLGSLPPPHSQWWSLKTLQHWPLQRSWGNHSFPFTYSLPPGVELVIQGILDAQEELTVPVPHVMIKQHW